MAPSRFTANENRGASCLQRVNGSIQRISSQ